MVGCGPCSLPAGHRVWGCGNFPNLNVNTSRVCVITYEIKTHIQCVTVVPYVTYLPVFAMLEKWDYCTLHSTTASDGVTQLLRHQRKQLEFAKIKQATSSQTPREPFKGRP